MLSIEELMIDSRNRRSHRLLQKNIDKANSDFNKLYKLLLKCAAIKTSPDLIETDKQELYKKKVFALLETSKYACEIYDNVIPFIKDCQSINGAIFAYLKNVKKWPYYNPDYIGEKIMHQFERSNILLMKKARKFVIEKWMRSHWFQALTLSRILRSHFIPHDIYIYILKMYDDYTVLC